MTIENLQCTYKPNFSYFFR